MNTGSVKLRHVVLAFVPIPIGLALAVAGLITASDGLATSGMPNRKASICQAVETSSTSRVRRLGTIETSSRS